MFTDRSRCGPETSARVVVFLLELRFVEWVIAKVPMLDLLQVNMAALLSRTTCVGQNVV